MSDSRCSVDIPEGGTGKGVGVGASHLGNLRQNWPESRMAYVEREWVSCY